MGFIYSEKETFRMAVEASTGGKNTVLYDDKGNPSIMVVIPKFKISDVIEGGANTTHPAFIVNGVEKDCIYIGKYQMSVVDGRGYSLPGQDPQAYINFDQARGYCNAKGDGWHLMTNAEWAAVALWCKKNGYMPRGNNNYGSDHGAPHEKGKTSYIYEGKTGRIGTGSGPVAWSHDGSSDGIYDLNGNVWEWTAGFRLKDGEINIIPNNDAAITNADMSINSTLWKAIKPDGSLVAPGTSGTLKWDFAGGKITLATTITTSADASRSTNFESLLTANGVTVPDILKTLIIHPNETGYEGDNVWMNNVGERLPYRGGSFIYSASAGVFACYLDNSRSSSYSNIGARVAYIS